MLQKRFGSEFQSLASDSSRFYESARAGLNQSADVEDGRAG